MLKECGGQECRKKQQSLDWKYEGSDNHIVQLLNKIVVQIVCEFVGCNPRAACKEGEVEECIIPQLKFIPR